MIKKLLIIIPVLFASSCASGPECCCALYSVNGNFIIGETMGAKSCAAYSKSSRNGVCVDAGVCEVKVDTGIDTN